jgi:putative Holliday junction resolvase
LVAFIQDYVKKEDVDEIVVGEPKDMHNNPSESAQYIEPFLKQLKKMLPDMVVKRFDERFTSVMAHQTMLDAGLGKKARQNKELVDTISATIILQSYMASIK